MAIVEDADDDSDSAENSEKEIESGSESVEYGTKRKRRKRSDIQEIAGDPSPAKRFRSFSLINLT